MKKIILASASPRRQQLLKELGIDFTVEVKPVDETAPKELKAQQIPLYLSQLKAAEFKNTIDDNTVVITADTIVWINEKEIGKPKDYADAVNMLKTLSGNMHEVFTGVTLTSRNKSHSFFVTTKVFFKPLTENEITYYLDNFKPFDKAGSYGIQEWLGYIGIEKIEGSYFNVMGLPLKELYEELGKFTSPINDGSFEFLIN